MIRFGRAPNLADPIEVSPWLNEDEFETVVRLLKSGGSNDMCAALNILQVWKARAGNKLSDVYEVTLCILSGLVQLQSNHLASVCLADTMTLSISTTVVRFVSLITEGSHGDKVENASVLDLAKEMGIPVWLVNMRHSIVHNRLPSVHMLQKALLYCLRYVTENFWYLPENQPEFDSADTTDVSIKSSLRAMRKDPTHIQPFIEVLISSRYPCFQTCMRGLVDDMVNSLLSHTEGGWQTGVESSSSLPKQLTALYKDLLLSLRTRSMLDDLVFAMADRLELSDLNPDYTSACLAWLVHIVHKSTYYQKSESRNKVVNYVLVRAVNMAHTDSGYVSRSLSTLAAQGCSQALLQLTGIVSGQQPAVAACDVTSSDGEQSDLLTVNDLTGVLDLGDEETGSDTKQQSDSAWQLASDINWSCVPMGSLMSSDKPINDNKWKNLLYPDCGLKPDHSFPDVDGIIDDVTAEDDIADDLVDNYPLTSAACEAEGLTWSADQLNDIKQSVQLI